MLALVGCSEFFIGGTGPTSPPLVVLAHEETFVQQALPGVDLLFVVDGTASMVRELVALSEDVVVLLDTLDGLGLDWQIGVVPATLDTPWPGWLSGNPYVITPTHPDPVTAFAERLPTATEAGEEGLAAAVAALERVGPGEPNAGFRRPGAALQVVFVSDADDRSPGPDPVADFLAVLPTESVARASGLVGDLPFGCSSNFGTAQPAVRYHEAVRATGGAFGSICTIDFVALLEGLGELSVVLPHRFELRALPDEGSLSARIDGEPALDWVLEGSTLVFADPPAAGATVRVRYTSSEQGAP